VSSFEANYQRGLVGETWIAQWLRGRGATVLPVYDIEIDQGKGPRLFAPEEEIIAPDMLVYDRYNVRWIEAKHKTAFSWHRISQKWVTGVDLRHYKDYCKVDDTSPWPVWLLFLHRGGIAKDSPGNSPSGLFGRALSYLRTNESHRSDRWAKGMVYWAMGSLHLLDEGVQ